MNKLPDDLLFNIFLLVEPTALLKLEQVCRAYNTIIKGDKHIQGIYYHRAITHYGNIYSNTISLDKLILLYEVKGTIYIRNNNIFKNCCKVESIVNLINTDIYHFPKLQYITKSLNLSYGYNIKKVSFPALIEVGENLTVFACSELLILDFRNLERVGKDLTLSSNNKLSSLSGIESLKYVGGKVKFFLNCMLTSAEGLEKLEYVGKYINFNGCCNIIDLLALNNIKFIGGNLKIHNIPNKIIIPDSLIDKVKR